MRRTLQRLKILLAAAAMGIASTNLAFADNDPEGVNLLAEASVEAYSVSSPGYKSVKMPVEGQKFTECLQIDVPKAPSKIHQVCLSASNKLPVASGDVIYMRWTGKSMSEGPGIGQLFVQSEKDWKFALANQVFELDGEWRTWRTFYKSPQNYETGTLYFNFFFGQQVQNVAMADIVVINCGQKNIDDLRKAVRPTKRTWNFEGEYLQVNVKSEKSHISGNLPAGWEDDSWWADVSVEYSKQTETPYSGSGALKVTAKEIRGGVVQFRVPAIRLEKPWFTKIIFALRSTTSSSVKFGLRKSGPPYTYYGQKEVTGAPEWQKTELLIPPVVNDDSASLMFEIRVPSVVEIDDVVVSYLSPDEVAGNLEMQGNLLTTSSFPLGVSYPWAPFHENYKPENYTADPENEGPTGVPALRIKTVNYEGDKGVAAVMCPFFGIGDRYYTYSFWAKAENSGHTINMRIGPPSERLWVEPYKKVINLGREWKRFKFTIKLPHSPDGFYLAQIFNWGPKGTFWIDGVQVEMGEDVSDFKRTGKVELAIRSAANAYGLVEEGTKFKLNGLVYGKIEDGMKIKSELFDAFGRSYPMPELKLQKGKMQNLEFELPEVGQPALGSYRLESMVFDARGEPVSKVCETLLHRVRPAKFADRLLMDSPFGAHITPNREMPAIARKLGFTWVRCFGLEWQTVEKEKGQWNLELLDGMIDNISSQNMCILGILGGVPVWARSWEIPKPTPQGYNNWHAKNVPPKNTADFAEYARKMAEHFKGRIQAFETWNEPFLPGFLNAGFENGKYIHPAPEVFIEMHLAAAEGLKKGNPNCLTVINLGAHYNSPSDKWSRELIEKGILKAADVISYHSYLPSGIGYPGDPIYNATKLNRNPEKPEMEVWNTEGGPGPSDIRNFYRHSAPLGKSDKAAFWGDYLIRYWVSTLASGADKFFLYLLYGWGDYKATYSLMNVDGGLHPCLTAFSNMAWHIEGRKYTNTKEIRPGLFAYTFEGQGGVVAVLISKGANRHELQKLNPNIAVRDLFGNPLELPAKVGDYAVFIEGIGMNSEQLLKAIEEQKVSLTIENKAAPTNTELLSRKEDKTETKTTNIESKTTTKPVNINTEKNKSYFLNILVIISILVIVIIIFSGKSFR